MTGASVGPTHADIYRLTPRSLGAAIRLKRQGLVVSYTSASPGVGLIGRLPVVARALAWLSRTEFQRTIAEYEGAFYRLQHETVRLTQEYYAAASVERRRAVKLYNQHYRTRKVGSAIKFLLQREVKRFLTWLYQHSREKTPLRTLVVPDDPLYRFLLERVSFPGASAWPVVFRGAVRVGIGVGLRELGKCWWQVLASVRRQGLARRGPAGRSWPIAFRAHWPRKEGLLRTDFLIDGSRLTRDNVLFYLEDRSSEYGRAMCRVLNDGGYEHIALNELPYSPRTISRLVADYGWLPLRACLATLRDPAGGRWLPLLASISQLLLASRVDLLLDHYGVKVLFSFHSAGYEMMVTAILCQRRGCRFLSYNFGITTFQAQWSDYAFHNAHAFLAWGPDVLAIYRDTHDFDEVVDTGFWGFPDYRKALADRERLRTALGVGRDTRLVVFYDSPYFPERSPFTGRLLLDFYRAALACAQTARTAVMIKMKNRHNENLGIYPPGLRDDFRAVWDEIRSRDNVTLAVTLDWDPLQMIAASDVNVTLELSTPSTIALLCGKPGFFFNTVEEYVHHPLFPKYKGRLIFDDTDGLVAAIRRCLEQREDAIALVEPGDLDGYNAGGDEAGLERFREEALMRAGLVSR